MITLLLALLVALAAGFAAWRVVVRRRVAAAQAARESAARTALLQARRGVRPPAATPPAPAPADAQAERASARAKAERVIAAEALRRKAAIHKAQNVARAEAERRAAEAARAAAELASTLPASRLPQVEPRAPVAPTPALSEGEKTAPLARPPLVEARTPAAPAVLKTPAQTLVMLVDDSKMVRVKSSRLLAAHGLQVVTAVDGVDALQQLEACCPDLLITDVDMPNMDGFGLVNALRADPRRRDMPLVMITSAEDRHREEALRLGVGLVMGKPYDEAALLAHIDSFQFFVKAAEPKALACA